MGIYCIQERQNSAKSIAAIHGAEKLHCFGDGTKYGQHEDIYQAKALYAEYKERKKTVATAKKVKR
jgi:hypothetical protein